MLLEKAQISSIEVITGTNELYALRDEWSQLWNRCPRATPFQSPEWLLPWWRCFGNDRLHTLLLRREGRLVAMLPAYILDDCFQLLGIGSSDHLDLIADPGFESDATGAMIDHLTGDQATWARCEFQQLAPDSPLLQHSAASGWREEATVQDFCPVLNLPDRVDDLRNCIPGNRLRKMEHYRRQAEKAGAVRFEKAREKNLGELVDALVDLHARRWDERGQASILAADAAGAFIRQTSAGSLAAGTLRFYALRIHEQIVAVLYGLADRRRFYYYMPGFDPAFAQLSVGNLLVSHAIEEAVKERLAEFDFLRGQEPYKYLWGAKDQPNWSRRMYRAIDGVSLPR